jgi:DNA-3-methyladenine glycosylase I
MAYHDQEWGTPLRGDDPKLFEFLILEGAQAGLSWITILRKRENYRAAFDGFDPEVVARYDDAKIAELMQNAGIVRNRLKINAAVTNARKFLDIQEEFGTFSNYLWRFVDDKPIQNHWTSLAALPAEAEISRRLSKDLQQRGFKFVGPTIVYSLMQACGLVNDHTVECFRHAQVAQMSEGL